MQESTTKGSYKYLKRDNAVMMQLNSLGLGSGLSFISEQQILERQT
jgi:hypothetical protein